jgi:hypothetical protein
MVDIYQLISTLGARRRRSGGGSGGGAQACPSALCRNVHNRSTWKATSAYVVTITITQRTVRETTRLRHGVGTKEAKC